MSLRMDILTVGILPWSAAVVARLSAIQEEFPARLGPGRWRAESADADHSSASHLAVVVAAAAAVVVVEALDQLF